MGAKRATFGDVLELRTSRGLAYGLYTHKDHNLGAALIRIFQGFHDERPSPERIVSRPVTYSVFVFLSQLVAKGLLVSIGKVEIPASLRELPNFKSRVKQVSEVWTLTEGGVRRKVVNLTDAEKAYPFRGIAMFGTLVDRVEQEWTDRDSSDYF